jgi:hypothetical protein
VIHRDLKPGNVALTPDGLLKVLDFVDFERGQTGRRRRGIRPSGGPSLIAEPPGSSMVRMGSDLPLEFSSETLAAICRRYAVRRLSAFGSVLRDDFGTESDIDLLVEFEPGRTPGFGFFRLQEELTGLFGRRVDLNTRASLSPYFRDRVLFEARALYVAA